MAKVDDIEIGGVQVELHADKNGWWSVMRDGERIGKPSYVIDDVMDSAKRLLAKSKVKVAVKFYDENGSEGVATGIHAGTGNVLVRIGGSSSQAGYRGYLSGDMPARTLVEYRATLQDLTKLSNRLREIRSEYGINLKEVVGHAIEEAS